MPKVRLALVGTRGIPARYGGFETFAEELSVRLVERGIDVTVYCEGRPQWAPELYRGVRLSYLPAIQAGAVSPILSDALALWQARSKFDVVYVLGYAAPMFFWLPRLFGRQLWVNMDGLEWARTKWGFLGRLYIKTMERIAVRMANMVIADAKAIKRSLLSRHPQMAPCSVIAYGAPVVRYAPDLTLLKKWGLSPQSYFISVCRLEPENHVLEIMQGFLRSSSCQKLIVVGSYEKRTPYIARLASIARAAEARIQMIGAVYDAAELRALRYYARAYFHGHCVGGTNPSLLEALGCGNLVVAHDNPFNREVCGDIAWYFSRETDIPAIVDTIQSLGVAKSNVVSDTARHVVAERYSWDAIADQYMQLLLSIRENPVTTSA